MAIDAKYGKIETEKGSIREDEPVFVLRAQDKLAFGAIVAYRERIEIEIQQGEINDADGRVLVEKINEALGDFAHWAEANPIAMKYPD